MTLSLPLGLKRFLKQLHLSFFQIFWQQTKFSVSLFFFFVRATKKVDSFHRNLPPLSNRDCSGHKNAEHFSFFFFFFLACRAFLRSERGLQALKTKAKKVLDSALNIC